LDKEQRQDESSFWGLEKEPRTSFWGMDKEPMSNLFDDVYENRERSLYDDDMELPMTRKSMEHRRSFWGQSRKPTTFWGLDKEQEHESNFWGMDKEQKHESNFWGLDKEPKTNFWGMENDFENVNEHENIYGENKRMVTPVLKHKIMEVENKLCVSLERIHECKYDSRPLNKVEKRVVYTCLHRNDPEVNRLVSRVRSGESVRHIVDRMTPSMTRTEVVPTKCTKMF